MPASFCILGSSYGCLLNSSISGRQASPLRNWTTKPGPNGRVTQRTARKLRRWRVADNGSVEVSSMTEAQSDEVVTGEQLVESVLQNIEGTDGGLSISQEKRADVDAMFEQLSKIGKEQVPRPLDNPLIFGNYEVSYVSSGKSQQGQPAGGRFRGAMGRTIFQTKGIYQSVLEPDIVTNKVEFALLGLLKGYIALRGRLEPVPGHRTRDTVKVYFEPPCLCLGGLHLSFGPESDVQLSTTYLDEKVRLGRGSRGSLFVFKRGGTSNDAGMDKVGREKSSPIAIAVAAAMMLGTVAGGCLLWHTGALWGRIASGVLGLLLLAMSAVLFKGGIVNDRGSNTASNSSGSRSVQ